MRKQRPADQRFWEKVERPSIKACWPWQGAKNDRGYGQFRIGGAGSRRVKAHRFAYEWFDGPIRDGLTIDHLCNNPSCVNPWHMEPVVGLENIERGVQRRTHCRRGHEYTPENTLHYGAERRRCKACTQECGRAYYRDVVAPQRKMSSA